MFGQLVPTMGGRDTMGVSNSTLYTLYRIYHICESVLSVPVSVPVLRVPYESVLCALGSTC